jgi:hypothetical protein
MRTSLHPNERSSSARARQALLVLALLLASGCYSYVPARVESVEPGQAVRVRLSPEEAERLEPVRMTNARVMDGVVLNRSDSELLVETPVGRLDPRQGTRPLHQRVNVPLVEIRDVELRERDNVKTGAILGGAALVAAVVVTAALKGGGGTRPVDGEGPAESWIPVLFRIAVP